MASFVVNVLKSGCNKNWRDKKMTKHIGVTANSVEELAEKMNKVGEDNNVFASQTHVTAALEGCVIYTAICFAKD